MNQAKSFSILKFYKFLGLDLGLKELKEVKFTSGENCVKIYFDMFFLGWLKIF